ncbi:5-dehydro-4-deoxy-D-glucuronate isomerase [Salibacterium sp. K-3]
MEIRYAANPEDFNYYDNERIRRDFLVENLFSPGELQMVYSHYDRLIIGGAIPTNTPLSLEDQKTLKTEYFLERREIGIINISGELGRVTVDGESYELQERDCLYVGKANKQVTLESVNSNSPAVFYLVSATAHKEYPIQKMALKDTEQKHLGSDAASNKRDLCKYIHEDGIKSCQLMLGMTFIAPNNMWNTMPPHVHDRRMEAYLYFDMDENSKVFHFMGEPDNTRKLVVQNKQAVLSPPWSIHSGVGTKNYTFIWAMAGENYTFTDMDPVDINQIK